MKKLTKTILGLGLTLVGSMAMAQCDNSNLSAWTSSQSPAGKMNVTAAAAMGGTSCGLDMEVVTQNGGQSTKHFVQDSSPNGETRYRAAFCVDPNSVNMATSGPNRRLKIHQAQCGGAGCDSSDIVQFKLMNNGSTYQLEVWVRDKNIPSWRNTNLINISDAPTRVEYDLDLTNSTFKVWTNATSESDPKDVDLSGLDISGWPKVSRARLGSMDKSSNAGTGDHFYLDEFESRRQTFIGGTCN